MIKIEQLDLISVEEPCRQKTATEPVICCASDGHRYVTKGALAGKEGLRCELIAFAIGQYLKLPIPQAAIIRVPEPLIKYGISPELKKLRYSNLFGSRYEGNSCQWIDSIGIELISDEMAERILFFDILIGNGDRSFRNPNLLWSHAHKRPVVIDHNAAFDMSITAENLMKDHYLSSYRGTITPKPSCGKLLDRFGNDFSAELNGVLALVPDEWYDNAKDKLEFSERVRNFVFTVVDRITPRLESFDE